MIVGYEESERCDNEVGAPENRIEWPKPNPDAPALKPRTPVHGSIVTARARLYDNVVGIPATKHGFSNPD